MSRPYVEGPDGKLIPPCDRCEDGAAMVLRGPQLPSGIVCLCELHVTERIREIDEGGAEFVAGEAKALTDLLLKRKGGPLHGMPLRPTE